VRLFDLSLKLNGFPMDKAKAELRRVLEVGDADFEAFNARRKEELVKFHLEHNPFYRNLVPGGFQSWESLPIMKKSDLQRPLADRLSGGYSLKNVYINKTSGSSGDPMVFAKDKFCHAMIWANIMRRVAWYGIDYNTSWQARFYGMPLDWLPLTKLRFKDWLSHRYRFNIFDFSESAMDKMIEKFRSFKFDYINGYAGSIVLLAKHLRQKNLVLRDICPTLKVCISTSEMLFDDDRKLLEKWLGVPVVNEYGAAELDLLAMEHPSGDWLVNAETTFVEIVDDDGNVLPYGREGRIIVTSLYNKAHPMIRYEVGDRGILDEKSTPQRAILKKLTGRTNDVAILPSGKISPGMTFYSITKALFEDEGNVREFAIKQTKTDTFDIEYTSLSPLTTAEIDKIKQVLWQFLEPGIHFNFIRKDAIERGKSGKLKQFISLIK
jgi:phenylacetate-CoA ligase